MTHDFLDFFFQTMFFFPILNVIIISMHFLHFILTAKLQHAARIKASVPP